ncbi:MAG TPA: helix-turn-helix domain-containing protein [Puia sp.]
MGKILINNFTEEELISIIKKALNEFFKDRDFSKADKKVLSRKEAAHYLKLSLPSLDKLTKQGKIKVSRLGRSKKYLLSDLDKAFEQLTIRFKNRLNQ